MINVIGIKEENCINCHQCIAVCPIKICNDGSSDVIKFNEHLCIGCGRCIEACIRSHSGIKEKSARILLDDAAQFEADLGSHEIIALIAPSARANFDLKKLITALKLLGVQEIYDVALGADMALVCYHEEIQSGKTQTPLISGACPVIVKYIELRHPALIRHLPAAGSPLQILAQHLHSLYPDRKMVFISPCPAKRREVRSKHLVDYNVTYQSLENIFSKNNICLEKMQDGVFEHHQSAGGGIGLPSPGGLKQAYLRHYNDTLPSSVSSVCGSIVYEKYLPDLQDAIQEGKSDLPLLIDILNCETGCNRGPGCINQGKSLEQIERSIEIHLEKAIRDKNISNQLQMFLHEFIMTKNSADFPYKDLSNCSQPKMPDVHELEVIYRSMNKIEEEDFRNCRACGYHSCEEMAIAVFNGLNRIENCHVYLEKELHQEKLVLNNMVKELEELNLQQEKLLLQNSKLASMGEMIGLIAHQWRQPLSSITTITGNLRVLIDFESYDRREFGDMLNDVNHHIQYLSNTINDFRNFFKPDNPKDIVYIDQIIDSTLGIIGRSLEYRNIELIKQYTFKRPINTYPKELIQAFLNIIKNASDALSSCEIDQPKIMIRGWEMGKHQVVEFENNGGGIPDPIMKHIFEPYFTTKGSSLGTGLGLYMTRMIVEKHCGGEITVYNTDTGVCFSIKLPI